MGAFEYPLKPVPEHSPVRVEFTYDLNGVVKVSVSQPGLANDKTVALSTATGGKSKETEEPKVSTVERKAIDLIASVSGARKTQLEGLLESYRHSTGSEREEAEEALLDCFLELDE